MPGRRSIGCIGSKVAFLCGVVCFSTCLRGWVNKFRLSFGSVTVFVVFVFVVISVDVPVWVRVIGATVFVSWNILIVFSLFSLFFQQETLTSVMSWFFLQWWHVGLGLSELVFVGIWNFLFVVRQGFPNHSALILSLDVWQFVHTYQSPNGPDLIVSSDVVALWHVWIIGWWHGQLFRMRLWPFFGIHQEKLLNFCWIEVKLLEFVFCCRHRFGFYVLPLENF